MSSFITAARHTDPAKHLPHQDAAWQWAWEQFSAEQQAEFLKMFRAGPPSGGGAGRRDLISADQARAVFQRSPSADQLADLNACLDRFSINTPSRIAHFLAQVGHESGGLRWMLELATGDDYEGRKDLGNTQPGDGRRFKGAGAIQLTGRHNYQRLADFLGDRKVMEGCGYVSTTYPFTSAGFWWHLNGMNVVVDQGASCRQVSARVNGRDPANGLEDREAYYARAVAALTASKRPPLQQGGVNPLPVPWYSQRDSETDQAARMCFSSSCAMLLEFLRPGTLKGANGDDQYLRTVQRFGDTTDAGAQVKALQSYGIKARFVQDADFALIKRQIDQGKPVPGGFIHRGPVDNPTGGGHWLIVIGYDDKGVIVHDPWGEADLVGGGTVSSDGRAKRYSYQNFGRRWMVELVAGFYRYAPGKGWVILVD